MWNKIDVPGTPAMSSLTLLDTSQVQLITTLWSKDQTVINKTHRKQNYQAYCTVLVRNTNIETQLAKHTGKRSCKHRLQILQQLYELRWCRLRLVDLQHGVGNTDHCQSTLCLFVLLCCSILLWTVVNNYLEQINDDDDDDHREY